MSRSFVAPILAPAVSRLHNDCLKAHAAAIREGRFAVAVVLDPAAWAMLMEHERQEGRIVHTEDRRLGGLRVEPGDVRRVRCGEGTVSEGLRRFFQKKRRDTSRSPC